MVVDAPNVGSVVLARSPVRRGRQPWRIAAGHGRTPRRSAGGRMAGQSYAAKRSPLLEEDRPATRWGANSPCALRPNHSIPTAVGPPQPALGVEGRPRGQVRAYRRTCLPHEYVWAPDSVRRIRNGAPIGRRSRSRPTRTWDPATVPPWLSRPLHAHQRGGVHFRYL